MGRNLDLTKNSVEEGVVTQVNILNEISDVITITVQPTKSYTVFPNALFQLDLQSSVPADLPDDSEVELWIEDVAGDQPIRIRKWQLGRFNNADQFDANKQVRLDIEKSYKLAELRKIIVKIKSSVAVDFTQATTDFRLVVNREG